MTERQRKAAFACAVLAVCATLALVSRLPEPALPGEGDRPAETAPVTTPAGGAGTGAAGRPRATIVGAPAPADAKTPADASGGATTRADVPADGASGSPPSDRSSEDAAGPARGRLAAARTATRARALAFMRALLRYEAGDLSSSVRAAIRYHADAPLATTLLAHPPRPPRGGRLPAAGRIASFEGLEPNGTDGFDAIALVARGSHRTPLVVTVERAGGRWSVTAVH